MFGTILFMLICMWVFCLGAGMLLAYLMWTPPIKES